MLLLNVLLDLLLSTPALRFFPTNTAKVLPILIFIFCGVDVAVNKVLEQELFRIFFFAWKWCFFIWVQSILFFFQHFQELFHHLIFVKCILYILLIFLLLFKEFQESIHLRVDLAFILLRLLFTSWLVFPFLVWLLSFIHNQLEKFFIFVFKKLKRVQHWGKKHGKEFFKVIKALQVNVFFVDLAS